VGDLQVQTKFPHGLSIRVIEQPPVATLDAGGAKTAVAANGVVLGTARASGALPTLISKVQLTPGERVRESTLRDELRVLGAAPGPLAKAVERAYGGPRGLTLRMRSGLLAYFGDASRPHAKWASLARVLADASSAGASYIDVRLPERPAAGFPAGVTPPAVEGDAGEGETGAPSSSESQESLAERLSTAAGGSASEQASDTSEEASSGEGETSSEASSEGEGASEASGEATSEATGETSGEGAE
jgi:hypothetical protein